MVTFGRSPFRADLLEGKVALVTGGATGLGLQIARVFGGHGARVAICSRKEANLKAAVAALRQQEIEAAYGVCDVRRPDEVKAVVEQVLRDFKQLDIVVNNAAGNFPVPIKDLSAGGFKAVVDIDLLGTFNVSKAALGCPGGTTEPSNSPFHPDDPESAEKPQLNYRTGNEANGSVVWSLASARGGPAGWPGSRVWAADR